jgi:hypothetical protein
VNCARSVVDLIMHYWPYSIDALCNLNKQGFLGSGQSSSPVRKMYVCCCDWGTSTKRHKQADLEKSFFGNSQGETVDLGAEQCMAFRSRYSFCPNLFHSGILVRNDATKDRLQQRLQGSLIMSGLVFLRQLLPDPCSQDPVREQGPRIQ